MKLSDAVLDFLSKKGVEQCFAVSGGAAAHIFNSISHSRIDVIHMHHEQACAMAADGYARVAKKPALVLVTNGPGVSNAITGVLGAYQDSIPMIVISGQVPSRQMISNNGNIQRQSGVQELDTSRLVESVVKYFVCISPETDVSEVINKAWNIATSGRPGPVWIEIPLDMQAKQIEHIEDIRLPVYEYSCNYDQVEIAINKAKKPLVIIGGGVHTANCESEIISFVKKMGIPAVSTWGANDVFNAAEDLYIGNFGILGNRIANYAVQKSDLLIILGSRMSIPNTGYQSELFSPNSFKIMVNLDEDEMSKPALTVDLPIKAELNSWLKNFKFFGPTEFGSIAKWSEDLRELNKKFNLDKEVIALEPLTIDSYEVVELLSRMIEPKSTLVTDMGTSFTCTMQAFRNFQKTRLFTSSGTSSMGFGLPGAIGAYYADKSRPIYLIAGDGGFQMNIQEMQTVVYHKIPIKMIILNSNGYLAITIMQDNLFESNYVGSNPTSGVDAPNFCSIGMGYGVESYKVVSKQDLSEKLKVLNSETKPYLLEIQLPSTQLMRPRSQSLKRDDGTLYSQGIEVMWPYLDHSDCELIEGKLS
jgi:acetolactate synthase-1/2/3 large subunit